MKGFTAEELAAMRLADEEIEREFRWTNEELEASRKRDRESTLDQKDFAAQKVAAQQKAYYEANREKIAAQQKAYYEANREKVAAQQKAYREANREKVAEYQKAYYEANREKVAEYQKAYREANREKINEKRRRKYREKRIRNQDGV